MAYWIHQAGNSTRPNYRSFYCDADTDIEKLPTSIKEGDKSDIDSSAHKCCSVGSDAFSIATGNVYILDSDNVWRSL